MHIKYNCIQKWCVGAARRCVMLSAMSTYGFDIACCLVLALKCIFPSDRLVSDTHTQTHTQFKPSYSSNPLFSPPSLICGWNIIIFLFLINQRDREGPRYTWVSELPHFLSSSVPIHQTLSYICALSFSFPCASLRDPHMASHQRGRTSTAALSPGCVS